MHSELFDESAKTSMPGELRQLCFAIETILEIDKSINCYSHMAKLVLTLEA